MIYLVLISLALNIWHMRVGSTPNIGDQIRTNSSLWLCRSMSSFPCTSPSPQILYVLVCASSFLIWCNLNVLCRTSSLACSSCKWPLPLPNLVPCPLPLAILAADWYVDMCKCVFKLLCVSVCLIHDVWLCVCVSVCVCVCVCMYMCK